MEYINTLNHTWISEADTDRLISYLGKWVHADELVKLIPSTKFNKKVTVLNSKQKEKSFRIYAYKTKIKGIKGNVLVVVAFGKWNEEDPKQAHVFVTNHCSLSAEAVIKKYALRWGIECIFRDLKENVAFDHYQVRTMKKIMRHWHLSALAYTFLYWANRTGIFSKWFKRHKFQTMGDYLRAFRRINSQYCFQWMMQNQKKFHEYLNIQPLSSRGIGQSL